MRGTEVFSSSAGLAVAHPALTSPRRNTVRNNSRVGVDRFIEDVRYGSGESFVLPIRKTFKLRYGAAINRNPSILYANNMSSGRSQLESGSADRVVHCDRRLFFAEEHAPIRDARL